MPIRATHRATHITSHCTANSETIHATICAAVEQPLISTIGTTFNTTYYTTVWSANNATQRPALVAAFSTANGAPNDAAKYPAFRHTHHSAQRAAVHAT